MGFRTALERPVTSVGFLRRDGAFERHESRGFLKVGLALQASSSPPAASCAVLQLTHETWRAEGFKTCEHLGIKEAPLPEGTNSGQCRTRVPSFEPLLVFPTGGFPRPSPAFFFVLSSWSFDDLLAAPACFPGSFLVG